MRAAVAIADLATVLGGDLAQATRLALATRIELVEGGEGQLDLVVADLLEGLEKKNLASRTRSS